tara:strand:- start:56 stop:1939 length:1884 start_codon:yes stop_codon:yes gene_type:complete
MAVITVRNLGQVRIAGETPTEQEKQRIGLLVQRQKEKSERRSLPGIVDDIDIAEGNERTEAIENYLKSKEFARLATEVGFAVGGAMTGGTLAAARLVLRPALQTLYRSLGAGFGQATGAGIASTTFDPKDELSKDVLRAFAQGATFEAVGAAVPALISKVKLRGIKTTKEADEAEQIIKSQKEELSKVSKLDDELAIALKEGQLTPGLQTENRFIDIAENVTEKSLFGGGKLIKARKGAETLTNKFLDDYIANYGDITRSDYGDLLQRAITGNVDEWKIAAKGAYQALDDKLRVVSGGARVDITNLKKTAQGLLDEAKPTERLQGDALKVLRTVLDKDDFVPFQVANSMRSEFLGVTRSTNELISGKSQRYAATLAKEITETLDDVGKSNLSPSVREAYTKAQKIWRDGSEVFNTKLINKLIREDPEQVFKTLIKPERPSTVQKVFKAINKTKDEAVKKDLKDSLKGAFLFDLKSESIKRYDTLKGDYLLKNLNKYGDSVLNELFTPAELANVRGLLKSLKVAQQKTVGEGVPGGVFIQLTQAGALLGLGTGMFTLPSAAILLTPKIISSLFTNPKFVNLLKQGFALKPGDPKYYRWSTRFINAMVTEGLIDKDEADDALDELESTR